MLEFVFYNPLSGIFMLGIGLDSYEEFSSERQEIREHKIFQIGLIFLIINIHLFSTKTLTIMNGVMKNNNKN